MSIVKSIFFIQCLVFVSDAFVVQRARQTSFWSAACCSVHSCSNRVLQEQEVTEGTVTSFDLSTNPNHDETATPLATTTATTSTATSTTLNTKKLNWMERARQLYAFQQKHGHTRVPKRYKEIPGLGNWVIKQRQHYRHYVNGQQTPLTEKRIDILNQLQFCWETTVKLEDDAQACSSSSSATTTTTTNDNVELQNHDWWEHFYQCKHEYEQLVLHYQGDDECHGTSVDSSMSQRQLQLSSLQALLDLSTIHLKWLREQQHKHHDKHLTDSQIQALDSISEYWHMTRREWAWELRFVQLQHYNLVHGNCCVPISYSNKQLANWVSNQRKQYNLRQKGKRTDLTNERLNRLQSIGFVWNRWEYEYQKQLDAA